MYDDLVAGCTLFRGLSAEDLTFALDFFEALRTDYTRGQFLNRIGEPLPAFGLVLAGTVQVYMDDIDGQPIIMANVSAGDTFGESLNFLGIDAPVYICAETDVTVLWMKCRRMKQGFAGGDRRSQLLSSRFTAMLAGRTLEMNNRIQILSKITLRDKLITFFSQYALRFGSNDFTLPFDRASMAVYLGTDRSALSRALSRLRQEGVIDFDRNRFRIKNSGDDPA